MAPRRRIYIEVCSGPTDGETFCTEMPAFTIGTADGCSLRVPDDSAPSTTRFELTKRTNGEIIVSDRPFTHAGRSVSELDLDALPAMIRVGFTDVHIAAEPRTAGDLGEALSDTDNPDAREDDEHASLGDFGLDLSDVADSDIGVACPHCGMVNDAGAFWCSRCGWDLKT